MRTRRFRFLRPGVLLLTLALIGMVPAPTPTEAAWVITTPTTSTMVGKMPSPRTTGCTFRTSGGTITGVVVTWRLPKEFVLSDVTVSGNRNGLALPGLNTFRVNSTNTNASVDDLMTTVINMDLLSGLSLGSTTTLTFQVEKGTAPRSWKTSGSVVITSGLASGLFGGFQCTPLNNLE